MMSRRTLLLTLLTILLLTACASGPARERGAGATDAGADADPPPADTGPPRECIAGATSCHENTPSRCSDDGSWIAMGDRCPALCHPTMGCIADDPCGRAVEAGSYIGCEYWTAPLPNDPSEHLTRDFDFRIVVANTDDAAAQVTVRRGGTVVATAEVAPGGAEEIVLPWIEALSRGIRDVGGLGMAPATWTSLTVPDGAYHVESDRPVVVYQFNPFHYRVEPPDALERFSHSNDASLLLPVHALGTRHYGLSYYNQSMVVADERLAEGGNAFSHPGYVAIVGIGETPTEVKVRPTAPIAPASDGRFGAARPGDEVRFNVARGEVVVVAAAPNPPCDASRPGHRVVAPSATGLGEDHFCLEDDTDLSGTSIESSGPVAVFGGHTCAFVPYDAWACDHLETQLPPATTLGRETVAIPLVDDVPGAPQHSLLRIVGVVDGTHVDLSPPVVDVASFTLDAGEVRELVIREAHAITASEGVLVSEILVGQLAERSEEAERGDPALLTLPPAEQFRTDYVFVTPTSYDAVPSFPGYLPGQSFVAITRPPGAAIRLDGTPLEGGFTPVGEWEVGVFPIAGGTHRLEGDDRFGLLVYGLGLHTSYAYPGGLDLEPILLF